MDGHLKLLADASLEVAAAEEAVDDSAWQTARDRLDSAGTTLEALRGAWPEMSAGERAVVGPVARNVRERLDSAAARVPRLTALTAVPAEVDPEQDEEP